jgi:flavodoxin
MNRAQEVNGTENSRPPKSLVIVSSYHNGNTAKIAAAMAKKLDARVAAPGRVNPGELKEYDLVGFGSGIDSDLHYRPLLDLADSLPEAKGRRAFIFSTCGIPEALFGGGYIEVYRKTSHAALREKLESKGYEIIGEFNCAGFNTNGFLKFFGGFNKGRPDDEDLENAEEFAEEMKLKARGR